MIGCLRTRVRKQPIIALYFDFETVFKFYNLRAWKRQYGRLLGMVSIIQLLGHCITTWYAMFR